MILIFRRFKLQSFTLYGFVPLANVHLNLKAEGPMVCNPASSGAKAAKRWSHIQFGHIEVLFATTETFTPIPSVFVPVHNTIMRLLFQILAHEQHSGMCQYLSRKSCTLPDQSLQELKPLWDIGPHSQETKLQKHEFWKQRRSQESLHEEITQIWDPDTHSRVQRHRIQMEITMENSLMTSSWTIPNHHNYKLDLLLHFFSVYQGCTAVRHWQTLTLPGYGPHPDDSPGFFVLHPPLICKLLENVNVGHINPRW